MSPKKALQRLIGDARNPANLLGRQLLVPVQALQHTDLSLRPLTRSQLNSPVQNECNVRAMEDQRGELLMILAGYPAEMEWFLAQNPGLRSRFPILIDFPDYTAEELLNIADGMWRNRQYELTPDARAFLRQMLQSPVCSTGGDEGNARAVRNLMERSLRCQALRLVGRPDLTREELMAVTRSDLETAAQAH